MNHVTTLLEAVRESLLAAARYNPGDMVAPVAILWTDADGQWQPLVELLRPLLPELLTLGEYQPENKIGPAIWLRCVIERVLPEVQIPDHATPVIYMPEVSRQMLRAVEECPDALKPLVEVQYRGVVWTQKNGRDWTIEAFLVSEEGGLGLDVAKDRQTRQAMQRALSVLAVTPLTRLRGKRLEAEDFDKLMLGDPIRDLLLWLNDPEGIRQQWDQAKWSAFCSRCKADYHFDPERDGEIVAGEKLGLRPDTWDAVWLRFRESPALYPHIPDLLRRAKPTTLIFDKEPWPDENEKQEKELREALRRLESTNPAEARQTIQALEQEHGPRRKWVWCTLGFSPLAVALQHLVVLAEQTATALGGDKESSQVTVPVASWHWNPLVRFAYGPGVSCFLKGSEYAHGGVSLQECLLTDLLLTPSTTVSTLSVKVVHIQWLGLRCRVTLEAGGSDIMVDLRTKPNDPSSTVTTPKKVEADGKAGLLVADETLEGTTVSLVVLDASGQVIGREATTIGG